MTQEAALHQFFSGFSIPAHDASNVPADVIFPYLTYTPVSGSWGDSASITVNVYYYGTTNADVNAKARDLSVAIGAGGVCLPSDDGMIWLKRGVPWSQALRDEADPNIRRRYINVTADFITQN